MKHKDIARRSRNQSPHPALSLGFALSGSRFARATFSQWEKDTPAECPSPSGRGCREAAGEGSENFVQKTRSNILVFVFLGLRRKRRSMTRRLLMVIAIVLLTSIAVAGQKPKIWTQPKTA